MVVILSVGSERTALESSKKAVHPDGLGMGEGGPS
jgi:hypothetical protein